MLAIVKRLRTLLLGSAKGRAIRRECDTLRRWSERGNDRYRV